MIPIIIAVAVALLAGGSVYFNWDEIVIAWKGKKIAVLGARDTGKTCLLKFLSTGSIDPEYRQSPSFKVDSFRSSLKDLDLCIKETLDVPGAKDAYIEWKELHDKADVVFYLLRADHLINGNSKTESRVREDMKHIGGWFDARKSKPTIFIVGTYCDNDPDFYLHLTDRMGDYIDKFRKLPIISELVAHAGGGAHTKVVLGSLKNNEYAEALVHTIFSQVIK